MSISQPKAVIFDFGGVLCFHPSEERFSKIASMLGLGAPDLQRLFWEGRIDYDAGRLDPPSYWGRIAKVSGRPLDEALLRMLVREEVALWNGFDERVLGWAAQLQARGFGTAILSNLPRPLGEELRLTPGFLDPFDHVTFSYELGVVKPQAAIYEDAVRGLNVAPAEALFLDDRPANVEGARAAGLMAELFSTWEEFVEGARKRYDLPLSDASAT
jgi:putative hydrolase of the HAD superfamily